MVYGGQRIWLDMEALSGKFLRKDRKGLSGSAMPTNSVISLSENIRAMLVDSFHGISLMQRGFEMIHSAEEFVRLRTSESRDDYVLAAEAEAPISVWLDTICRFPEMKEWVAHNRTIPLEVLEVLADDADPNVRAAVENKRKLNEELFNRLSRDPDEVVRKRIAYNKKTPIEIIRRLATDEIALVREAAQKMLAQRK